MSLNYRHSLETMNKELLKKNMRFTTIGESSISEKVTIQL